MVRSRNPRWIAFAVAVVFLPVAALVAVDLRSAPHAVAAPAAGRTRTYFVAADEVRWNYAPDGTNDFSGHPFTPAEQVFVANGPDRIGSTYIKAQYREYTDVTFSTLKPRTAEWKHLGILGPVIHAEVGDSIRFVFRNNTSVPVSVHPHGVLYTKAAEGAPYADGTTGALKADDSVAPGGTYAYIWRVPERAGPGPADGSSVMWMYHSHVDEPADTNAGLVGPIIITRRGMARPDGSPMDVDREFVTMFSVMNENESPFLQKNIDTFAGDPSSVDPSDDGFIESNLMHSINGYVYGNLPGLDTAVGQRTRFYLMGMGTEVDLHTPHWHGNTLTVMGMRTDVVSLLPMSMVVADMIPDAAGIWAFHCHVNDHIKAGMMATYHVAG